MSDKQKKILITLNESKYNIVLERMKNNQIVRGFFETSDLDKNDNIEVSFDLKYGDLSINLMKVDQNQCDKIDSTEYSDHVHFGCCILNKTDPKAYENVNHTVKRIKISNDITTNLFRFYPNKEVEIKGIIVIVHGFAEHLQRYDDMISYFVPKGFIVFGADLRHHGTSHSKMCEKSECNPKCKSCVIQETGVDIKNAKLWTEDLSIIIGNNVKEFYEENKLNDIPVNLFGHSLGFLVGSEFLATNFYKKDGKCYVKVPNEKNKKNVVEIPFKINRIIFSGCGTTCLETNFIPAELSLDSISEVKLSQLKYALDPDNKFAATLRCAQEFVSLMKRVKSKKYRKNIMNLRIPILLLSGENDSTLYNEKELEKLLGKYKNDESVLVLKQYKGSQHEVHSGINKVPFFEDILEFIGEKEKESAVKVEEVVISDDIEKKEVENEQKDEDESLIKENEPEKE